MAGKIILAISFLAWGVVLSPPEAGPPLAENHGPFDPSASSGQATVCHLCGDTTRDQDTIVVVEKTADIDVFLKTDYHGLFFVLGGLIPITQKSIIDGTNTNILIERVKKESNPPAGGLTEVILAFPLTPNGDHTDSVIRDLLGSSIKISSLGRGLSTGTELEYADPASLEASLKKRE